jgi:glycosyltransferase A (GT-A) superfamily protein (DUF2064 family)
MTDPNQIDPSALDPSVRFGQEGALFAYEMARSLFGESLSPDQLTLELLEDAVRTAVRLEGVLPGDIDVGLAILGLRGAIVRKFEAQR